MTAPLRKNVSSTAKVTRLTPARCSHDSSLMPYRLYPIFRRNSLRAAISAGPSTPFGKLPSITPITPRPCSVFATSTSTGLAVAQKIEHTSGMFCTTFNRFMGYASRRMRTKTCPAPKAWALAMAAFRSSSSLPSARVRHGPEDSLKASPNLACGTVFTTASYMSSAVLMKCVWPTMMLVSSGNLHPDRFKLEHKVLQRCEMRSHHSAGTAGLRGQLQMACALALCLTQSVTRAHTCSIPGNHDLLRHSWPERNVMKD